MIKETICCCSYSHYCPKKMMMTILQCIVVVQYSSDALHYFAHHVGSGRETLSVWRKVKMLPRAMISAYDESPIRLRRLNTVGSNEWYISSTRLASSILSGSSPWSWCMLFDLICYHIMACGDGGGGWMVIDGCCKLFVRIRTYLYVCTPTIHKSYHSPKYLSEIFRTNEIFGSSVGRSTATHRDLRDRDPPPKQAQTMT